MGAQYILVNESRKEKITYIHLNGSKQLELSGNYAQSAITTWYLIENRGDDIQFVSDTENEWPFSTGSRELLSSYSDVTSELLEKLIEIEILEDRGMLYVDESEPELAYIKDIVNVWV